MRERASEKKEKEKNKKKDKKIEIEIDSAQTNRCLHFLGVGWHVLQHLINIANSKYLGGIETGLKESMNYLL